MLLPLFGAAAARLSKTACDLTSVKFHGLELMRHTSGHPAGYWEQNPADAAQIVPAITIDPSSNAGERGELAIKGLVLRAGSACDIGRSCGAGNGLRYYLDRQIQYRFAARRPRGPCGSD